MEEEVKSVLQPTQGDLSVATSAAPSSRSTAEWISSHHVQWADRHCAFCCILIPAEKVKFCSQCHIRAYCSRKCQKKDWKPKNAADGGTRGAGQGHKSWCGLPFGEEDLDWKLAATVDGKLQGLVAKRFIPEKSRILVEGLRKDFDCTKLEGLRSDFDLTNLDDCAFTDEYYAKCRKYLGRSGSVFANHNCNPNASQVLDIEFKTMILVANRDIQPGEQICLNYSSYNEVSTMVERHGKFLQARRNIGAGEKFRVDLSSDNNEEVRVVNKRPMLLKSFEDSRKLLQSKWEIVCSRDCLCRDAEADKSIAKWRRQFGDIFNRQQDDLVAWRDDLETARRLLKDFHHGKGSCITEAALLEIGFKLAVQKTETLNLAEEFIKEAHNILSNIYHPRSRNVLGVEHLMEDPKSSKLYLIGEKSAEE